MKAITVSEYVASSLKKLEMNVAFGIPGIHNLALYRSFQDAGFSIYDTRHEQGAAFMADGYARANGRPAVCILIDGPGFLNAATAIAQAKADSIPMLVVTSGAPTNRAANTNGWLHELPEQIKLSEHITRASYRLDSQNSICALPNWLNTRLNHARPGPLHVEIPLDLMNLPVNDSIELEPLPARNELDHKSIASFSSLLNESTKPLVVLGGGASKAKKEAQSLIEKLDAPCINTVNGKGIIAHGHPLHVGGSPSLPSLRTAMHEADALLAVGTEFGETDYDLLFQGSISNLSNVLRIDIDREQLSKNVTPVASIHGDARLILPKLIVESKDRDGRGRSQALRDGVQTERFFYKSYFELLSSIQHSTDILVGDSSQPNYFAAWMYEPNDPGGYFHSVSGFGTLGFAIPASIGAKLARPDSRVICLIGDGGAQFSFAEIRTAVVNQVGLPIIIWNSDGYEEINKAMKVSGLKRDESMNLAPEFQALARAMGATYVNAHSLAELKSSLDDAHLLDVPTIIELHPSDFIHEPIENWYR